VIWFNPKFIDLFLRTIKNTCLNKNRYPSFSLICSLNICLEIISNHIISFNRLLLLIQNVLFNKIISRSKWFAISLNLHFIAIILFENETHCLSENTSSKSHIRPFSFVEFVWTAIIILNELWLFQTVSQVIFFVHKAIF
jgi:hypothetical protein